jgi:DNA-binding FadR family transcriptional regulator
MTDVGSGRRPGRDPDRTPDPVTETLVGTAVRQQRRGARLGTAVVDGLVDAVVSGHWPSGALLPPEADLCDSFDVSRTVVRESIKVVQEKGLVRIVHGRGTIVTDQREWNMIDETVLESMIRQDRSLTILDELVTVRSALEREMAANAARLAGAEDKARLAAQLRTMEESIEDIPAFAEADVRFHDVVMDASGNRLSRAIVTSIHGKARTSTSYHGAYSTATMKQTLAEHAAVQQAIERGDAEAAGAAMAAHIEGSWARRRPSALKQAEAG